MCYKKFAAELFGTMTLVLVGCGAAVIAGPQIGFLGIGVAFGLALIGAAYAIGWVSGCHINPAVSFGAWIAGRMTTSEMVQYMVAQFLGGILGAVVLYIIVSHQIAPYDLAHQGLGQNGWGPGYLGQFDMTAAFVFEMVATFIFVSVILGSTAAGAPVGLAGLAIGLTLVAIHLFGIPISGSSLNPARSLGPAVLVGGQALSQLWLFFVAPMLGAALAGIFYRRNVMNP
ncbi:MAG: aquaporin [Vampirovibrionales bacterium]|nr:aquaporin [Vampirovibrionales bacterium]